MAALFSVTPPLSSSLLDSQGGNEAPAAASQEGGGASHSEGEGPNEEGKENSSGNEVNHKSLRHHVSLS